MAAQEPLKETAMRLPLAGLVIGVASGLPAAPSGATSPALELPSCVAGSPPLRVPASTARAILDASDRRQFDAAAQARYPMVRRGGGVPAQVVLLQRGGLWQYLTLWPDGATGLCLAAAFAADRFDFTPAWLAKYRPRAGDADD
jgi:hypothetical protein